MTLEMGRPSFGGTEDLHVGIIKLLKLLFLGATFFESLL
jgi:hypothetical protein